MCGICGKFNNDPARPVAPELLREMRTFMAHRGPDDSGLYTKGPVGLGHRRISIIDVAGGHRPISNADGTVWVVFNGEIYNHLELRRDLEARGYRYKTRSDTETILHAYEGWGSGCLARLRGMFAFAIWDARASRRPVPASASTSSSNGDGYLKIPVANATNGSNG